MSVNRKGIPFRQTTTHATSAVASEAAVAGKIHWITDISGSSDKSGALLLVKSATTIIWQAIIDADFHEHHFDPPLEAVQNELVSVTVDGTSKAHANIAGITIPVAGEGAGTRFDQ